LQFSAKLVSLKLAFILNSAFPITSGLSEHSIWTVDQAATVEIIVTICLQLSFVLKKIVVSQKLVETMLSAMV